MFYLQLRYRVYTVYAWGVFILVLLLSPLPFDGPSSEISFFDKIVHAILFGVFSFLIFYALKAVREDVPLLNPEKQITIKARPRQKIFFKLPIRRVFALFSISFFCSVFFAISMEHVQMYIPGRFSSEYDLLAGICGVALSLVFIYGANFSRKKR